MTPFRAHLNEKHFAPVSHTISAVEIQTAVDAFLNFLTLVPDTEKRKVHFKSTFERGSADGYSDKRDDIGKDPKEFFHWSPLLLDHPAYHELSKNSSEARAFFDTAERLYKELDVLGTTLFQTEFPELAEHCIVDNKLSYAMIRFLCYAPNTEKNFSAQPHYDKGYGTLALAESTPGLRIGCCDKHPLEPVVHTEGTALFMPADLMFGDSNHTIIPAWHDVVTDPLTPPVSTRCARWAIVFFICDKNGRFSPWDKVHKPLNVHE